jgi:hypothetical protein
LARVPAAHLHRVNNNQLATRSLDSEDLDRDVGVIITEIQPTVGFGRIMRRRLVEGQAAVPDDVANLIISYAMPLGGLENPDRQRLTP